MGFSRNEYLGDKNRKYFRAGKSKPDLINVEIIFLQMTGRPCPYSRTWTDPGRLNPFSLKASQVK